MCNDQEKYICVDCNHKEHLEDECPTCECYKCEETHDYDVDDHVPGYNCCRCDELRAKHLE